MATGKLNFRFTSAIVRLEQGVTYHALPVPDAAAAAWKKAQVRRLIGTINGHPARRALMSHAGGGSFLIVGRELMRQAGISGKAPVRLEFRPDPAPDQLDLPEEFRLVLDQDHAARARWESFTTGRQRSLLIYITGARTEPTRIKRAVELARLIRTRTLHGDLPKKTAAPGPQD
jgi:hypothetical protein